MKTLPLLLTVSLGLYFTNTQSISLREYMRQYGMPVIANGCLALSNKNLTSLEGLEDIPNLNLVRELYLHSNQLQSLPANIFDNLAQLQVLRLDQNQLQTLPANIFGNLAQLQELYLNSNQLQSLPENIFGNLAQLQGLYLPSNQLQSLPNNIFANLAQLQMLGLNDNQLQSLPENIFGNLAQLQELDLNNNQLQSLPENIFDNLVLLQELSLSNNQLKLLPANIFDNLVLLQELRLHNNQLQTLPADIFGNLAQLERLFLNGNQLQGTTQQFRDSYLANKARVHLSFKGKAQEENEALEQKYFQTIAGLPVYAKQEKANIIKTLKDLGKDSVMDVVSSRDAHGNTLLHKSILLCNPLLVKLIAKLWPDSVVAKNTFGRTSLHVVATLKNRTVALCMFKELVAASSAPEQLLQIKDNAGDTPLQIAVENCQWPILQYLLAFEDIDNTWKLGKSRKLNALLQQPDLAKAFEILHRNEAQSQKKQQ